MFKLHRLDISGFKSFPDPVSLDFSGGLTAVVGPNGCGKSNVADAVLWVLGERSAKVLRSTKMEDVIFNGAAGRKPLGSAEVNIELRTDPTFSLADDGRLVIGRRVFRSGESQYRLNGKRVRLKEIRDLLMDTGLGIRAYSVIEQGRIGMILSSKPQERRRLLEEAAGITRYKERKRLTEMKLEEARGNLERLDDIIDEVKRQLRSLKRQANAARRYRDRESAYKGLLRQTLEGRWSRLFGELSELRAQRGDTETREAGLAAQVHSAEATIAADREQTEAQARELAAHHRRQAELAARIEGKQEFLKGSRERLEETAERLTAGQATREQRYEQIEDRNAALSELETRHGELDLERNRANDDVTREDERIATVETAFTEMEARLEELRTQLLASIGSVGSLRNRLHREQVETEKGRYRQGQLGDELKARRTAHAEAETNQRRGAERLAELEGSCTAAESELAAAEASLAAILERQAAVEQQQTRQRDELSELVNRRRVLTQLGEAQAERRRALEARLRRAGLERLELLTEGLSVPEGWERSLDLYLGELADAVLVGEDADSLDLAGLLSAEGGATRLIQIDDTVPLPTPPSDPAIEGSLAAALGLPDALAAALPPAYLTNSREDAVRLARTHPGLAFLSRDRSWAQAGVLHIQGAKAEPGALARRREMESLMREVPAAEARLQSTVGDLEGLARERSGAETAVGDHTGIVAELRQQTAVARARADDLTAAARRLRLESETLATELSEIGRELDRIVADSEALAGQMTQSESRHAELEAEFDSAQKELNEARDRRENARTSGVSRRGHLQLLESRLEAHGEEMARVRGRIDEDRRQIADWDAEAGRLESRRGDIGHAMKAAQVDLQEALETRATANDSMRDRQTDLDERQGALHAREREIRNWRHELDDERSGLTDLRVHEATLTQDAEHLEDTFQESFDEPLPESPGEVPADLEKLESELARSKEILEGTGPVNLLAAQEYDEQQERYTFLTEQHADVLSSIESLKSTIREINETSSERFLKTFLEVNESFGKTFRELFRGGDATMRMLDEEDILDSGIEIVARPPGKRQQNIMLLSGGEKALTAIALLFALFRTKPSPFCILDEVDAPLDDVNTLRFVDMLKKMGGETQFVVMTHNKLTMEASSRLYGVTMQERGVSSIVSVELDEIHPIETPAAEESASA